MLWIKREDREPTEPFMSFGWSNHILAYSMQEEMWFEAVYHFKTKKFYTLEHDTLGEDACIEKYGITHFCEEIPLPKKE